MRIARIAMLVMGALVAFALLAHAQTKQTAGQTPADKDKQKQAAPKPGPVAPAQKGQAAPAKGQTAAPAKAAPATGTKMQPNAGMQPMAGMQPSGQKMQPSPAAPKTAPAAEKNTRMHNAPAPARVTPTVSKKQEHAAKQPAAKTTKPAARSAIVTTTKAEPKKAESKPAVAKTAKPAAKPVQKASAQDQRRDPFKTVIQEQKAGGPAAQPVCPQGVRGILISQVDLNGIARTPSGFIGVVTTRNNDRTWFLRDNQPLCNGRVAHITADSIVFEENVIDPLGKAGTREVIRKIPAEAK